MTRRGARRPLSLLIAAAALLLPTGLALAFPGTDPDESVRINTPDDPRYDRAEPDREHGKAGSTNVFDQELERFGFAPSGTEDTATYKDPEALDPTTTTRREEQNLAAGRNRLGQISGVSADRAWKRSIGRPDVQVAVLDSGVVWERESIRTKIALNAGELPEPQADLTESHEDGVDCDDYTGDGLDGYDLNDDGALDVLDYACDSRVDPTAGSSGSDVLDPSDLIAAFSNGEDSDGNGYPDDIAGWDFFDDDNDPLDASSYAASVNHGVGRMEEAAERTHDGRGGTGVCPRCQVVPLRVWDTFVVDTNNFSQGVVYAADNDIEVVAGAVGGLLNSRFSREAFSYAYRNGTFPAIVSSDLNTANHNVPTVYDEAMMVSGTVSDVHGLGEDASEIPGMGPILDAAGLSTNLPVSTWFRRSGTTQYGGHAQIVMPAVTGSQATGQAAGAAGLLISHAREQGTELEPNEVKQLLTMTAEDVVAENTVGAGVANPAHPGWDQHFGYGRPDLGLALERIAEDRIPPQALITSPDWFAPFEVSRESSVTIAARLTARVAPYDWTLEWAPGIEPSPEEFREVASGSEVSSREGALGTVDLGQVRAALDARPGGGGTEDPTAPQRGVGDPDPNEPAFTVRVRVTDDEGEQGEDRKMLFAYSDPTLRDGWPRVLSGGVEASHRLYDLSGDNRLEVVESNSSGEVHVVRADGTPLPSFNGGEPVRTRRYANVRDGAAGFGEVEPPLEAPRTPVIGDITGDREPEIVTTAGEHVYAWGRDGGVIEGFPVRVDPALSRPEDRTRDNHVKRGFFAGPTLADLDGDGALDVIAPALDQHVYAVKGDGSALPGFPAKLADPGEDLGGAETINAAAVGDITGDGRPEIVVATNEVGDATSGEESDVASSVHALVTNLLANAIGGTARIYALDAGGGIVEGWPARPNAALPDVLPLIGPGVDQVLADVDGDGSLDVIGPVASGDVQARKGDGSLLNVYDTAPATGEHVDKSRIVNLFENPIVADLRGEGDLVVAKGGMTLLGLINIGVLVGQNLPYNHVVQAWDAGSGNSLPAFPQAVEDFQLLSSPAVADVTDAPGSELLVGTGLYYLRAMNADGQEGSGWPKFTGGWIYGVPAIGDVDASGRLSVVGGTRAGRSFLWQTEAEACGRNDEWWTHRHDEWSTGARGVDSRPPGSPRELTATRSQGALELSWVAPGGDWLCGSAERFEIRVSTQPIRRATDGRAVATLPAQAAAGERESATIPAAEVRGARHVGVLYRDGSGEAGAQGAGREARTTAVRRSGGNWGIVASASVAAPGERPERREARPPAGGPEPEVGPAVSGLAAGESDRDALPFTGLPLLLLLLLAAALIGAGVAERRGEYALAGLASRRRSRRRRARMRSLREQARPPRPPR